MFTLELLSKGGRIVRESIIGWDNSRRLFRTQRINKKDGKIVIPGTVRQRRDPSLK